MARSDGGRLHILVADQRAAFLLLALPDAALRKICRRLGVSFPGYRLEKIRGAQLARALAEEYETDTKTAAVVDRCLHEHCRAPFVIPGGSISPGLVDLMTGLAAAVPEQAVTPLLWQFFSHPHQGVRRAGSQALETYTRLLDAAVFADGGRPSGDPRGRAGGGESQDVEPRSALRRRLQEAETRVTALAREVGAARSQLTEVRRQIALVDERLAQEKEARRAVEERLREAEASRAALASERNRDAVAEARRLAADAERQRREVENLLSELVEARRREAELTTMLRARESGPAPSPARRSEEPVTEEVTPWIMPVFTSEFYESVRRWEARTVKAAFDKIRLLCTNLGHPGLDAKPIQGVDGLYRIFVAQDVRLFYRRRAAGQIEVLSLIDREDLDRYIRAYKSRVNS